MPEDPREKVKTLFSDGWGVSLPSLEDGTRRLDVGLEGGCDGDEGWLESSGRNSEGMMTADVWIWVAATAKVEANARPLTAIQLRESDAMLGEWFERCMKGE